MNYARDTEIPRSQNPSGFYDRPPHAINHFPMIFLLNVLFMSNDYGSVREYQFKFFNQLWFCDRSWKVAVDNLIVRTPTTRSMTSKGIKKHVKLADCNAV
eukprot:sb/3478815/